MASAKTLAEASQIHLPMRLARPLLARLSLQCESAAPPHDQADTAALTDLNDQLGRSGRLPRRPG